MRDSTSRPDSLTLFFALLLALLAAYFLLRHALPRLEMTESNYGEYYWPRRFWLLAHTVGGLLATMLGALQFSRSLRARYPGLHRTTGKVYLVAVLAAALCAYVLAVTSQISRSYEWGLIVGASLWLATGALAYSAIRRRQVARHRAWMVRNYTVTFFFIVFFAAYDIAQFAGWTDVAAYAGPLVLGCLVAPLAIVEIVLRARGLDARQLQRE
jgi:uncharacterized membrane protein